MGHIKFFLLFEPSRRPLTIKSFKFFDSGPEKTIENYPIPSYQPDTEPIFTHSPGEVSNKSPKPYGLKTIGKTNCFEIELIKVTFSIQEFVNTKRKIVGISETDTRGTNKFLRQIWISIPAAQILLEKIEEVSKRNDNTGVECLAKERWLNRFNDKERNELIALKLVDRDRFYHTDHLGTKFIYKFFKVAKGSSIFIPLNGVPTFQEKLSNILRQYKKWSDFNKETGKKLGVYVPIAAARTLFNLLKDGFMTVQRYEGRLPDGMQPLDVLYEKRFIHKNNQTNVMIDGKGAHLLLQHYEEILREYDRLKSYLTEADSSKPYEPIEEPKKRTFDQKINPTKAETEPNDLMSEER